MSIYYNSKIKSINDESLYHEGVESTNRSLYISKGINEPINDKYNIFIYWIGDNVSYKHSVVLKSFLATQNLENATLKIYCDSDISKNKIFDRYRDYKQIEFHIFDIEKEISGTKYEDFKYTNEIKNHSFNAPYESDFFRLLMLHKYGGFYIDFDVLLLRDMSPLLEYDFLYQWGSYPNNMINGAIMHLKKDSKSNNLLTDSLLNTPASPGSGSLKWASELYLRVKDECDELVIFPAAFFNSEWQWGLHSKNGYFLNPFKKYPYSNELFDGCFTWHWHNGWNESIEIDSKFDTLDKLLESFFIKKFYN